MSTITPAQFAIMQARLLPRMQAPPASKADEQEKDMHAKLIEYLTSLGQDCYWVHSRMDKPATVKEGTPDFVGILKGRAWAVEMKAPRRKGPTTEQLGELLRIRLAGGFTHVAWSYDSAVGFMQGIIGK